MTFILNVIVGMLGGLVSLGIIVGPIFLGIYMEGRRPWRRLPGAVWLLTYLLTMTAIWLLIAYVAPPWVAKHVLFLAYPD